MGLSWSLLAQTELQKSIDNLAAFPDQFLGLTFGIGTQSTILYPSTWNLGAEYSFAISKTEKIITHLGFDLGYQNQLEFNDQLYSPIASLGMKLQNSQKC